MSSRVSGISGNFDRSDFAKIRPKQRGVSGVSTVSRTSISRVSSPSRFSANKIAPSGYSEKKLTHDDIALGDDVRMLLINCYNNVELNKNLRALLKLLTANCPKYIDGVFAGHADYNDYDLKKVGTLEYRFNKFYYEKLMSMYRRSCINSDTIISIYSIYYSYNFKQLKPEDMKMMLKEQLLRITPMTPYIRSIINDTPNDEASSYTGGKTNKPKQPTKLLFGKVRRIYKKSGDKKEYVKHKGLLITIKQYKDIRVKATKNRGK
jgi:hypothetical protein